MGRILLVLALIFAALLLVGPRLIDTYTNWLWFGEVDFRQVYTTTVLTRVALFLLVGSIVGGIVFLALLLAYRNRPVFVPVAGPNDPIARYRTTVMSRLRLFGIGIPVALGVLSGLIAQANWVTVQLFLNGGDFGITDPQFGLDIGFYSFDLPFYRFVLNWLFVAFVVRFLRQPGDALRIRWDSTRRTRGRVHARRAYPAGGPRRGRSCCSRPLPTGSIGTRCSPARARNRHSAAPASPTSTQCFPPS